MNSAGLRQAGLLGELFSAQQITVVQSSPRLRARQTAWSIANACELPVAVVPADCGRLPKGVRPIDSCKLTLPLFVLLGERQAAVQMASSAAQNGC